MEEILRPKNLVEVQTTVYLTKEDREFAYNKCDESYCTFQEMVQVAVESAIRTLKES